MIVTMEGNIGTGKSSTGRVLAEVLRPIGYRYCDENVDVDPIFKHLLSEFNNGVPRAALNLQTWLTNRRANDMVFGPREKVIYERSIHSDMIFSQVQRNMGFMNDEEFCQYRNKFVSAFGFMKEQGKTPQTIIYLQNSPEVCFERMKHRNRNEESNVSLEYLKTLHDAHESYFSSLELREPGTRIVRVTNSGSDRSVINCVDQIFETVFKR